MASILEIWAKSDSGQLTYVIEGKATIRFGHHSVEVEAIFAETIDVLGQVGTHFAECSDVDVGQMLAKARGSRK